MFTAGQYNKWRLIIIVMLIVAGLLASFSAALFIGIRSIMLEQIQAHARGIATLTAIMLRNDIEEYRALSETLDDTLPQYARMCGLLRSFKDMNNALYLYTLQKKDDTHSLFILDGDNPNADTFCSIGHIEESDESQRTAYSEKKVTSISAVTVDHYGVYITGYAPIIDTTTGEVLGLVGVDMDATQEDMLLNNILRVLIITSSFILVALLVVLLRFSDSMLMPVYRDALTGVYNRKYFERFLRNSLVEALRYKSTMAVIMLDLDHFKKVNDEYGHPFGDTVLTQVAHIIGYNLRKSDCLARFGGEEFIAALPNIGRDEATVVSERIRSSVENARIYNSALDMDVSISVSMGIAVSYDSTYDRIVSNADQALYYSKANGRNRITLYFQQPAGTEDAHT